MKKIFTTCVLLIGLSIFAQEAGKAGELLKNEASRSEMQTRRSDVSTRNATSESRKSTGTIDNSNYRKPGNNTATSSPNKQQRSYRWHQNYGYSEVFLRIPEYGYFSVEIGDQMISNASGKFRFYDLNPGRVPVSIYEDGYLVYRTRVNIQNNRRLVLDFFSNQGLYLLDSYPVQNQTYGFNEWDDVWNNPYGSFGNNYNMNVMNDGQFVNFLKALRQNSFDDSKLQFIQQQSRSSAFTTQQIRTILKVFSFDDDKVDAGKLLYNNCVDKQNFYRVYDAFSFDSSKRELMQYISRFG